MDLSYGDETRGSYDTRVLTAASLATKLYRYCGQIGTLVSSQPQLRTFLQTIKGWALSQEEGILNSQRQALSTFALILLGLCYYNRNLRREQPVEVDGFFDFITREIGNLDASVCHIWVEEGQLKHVVDEEDDEDRSRLTRSPLKILVSSIGLFRIVNVTGEGTRGRSREQRGEESIPEDVDAGRLPCLRASKSE